MAIYKYYLAQHLFLYLLLSISFVESTKRLSQHEGVKVKRLRKVNEKQRATASDYGVGVEEAAGNDDNTLVNGCADGWANYQNELCFYGIQEPKLPFYYGRQQCAQLEANFTSVHSLEEFQFIAANFDLRQYWMGIVFGSDHFEDGTPVDVEVLHEFAPLVPWADPNGSRGFICKTFANLQQQNGQ